MHIRNCSCDFVRCHHAAGGCGSVAKHFGVEHLNVRDSLCDSCWDHQAACVQFARRLSTTKAYVFVPARFRECRA
jgi:hypothetical protein